jgi:outer membrane lipase/esterase
MTFGEQNRDSLVGEIGWAVKGAGRFSPYAHVAYGQEAEADRRTVTAGLVSLNGDFDMPGYEPEENWISAGAGLSLQVNDSWGVHAAYAGRFADDDRRTHMVMVGVSGAF